jgi:SAM-dependent methyltransferase
LTEDGYTPQPPVARVRRAVSTRGVRPVVGDLARFGTQAVAGLPWTARRSRGTFELMGRRYPYLYHRHKLTWLTERAVEVPVAQAIVDGAGGKRVLEIGNVLSHYRPQTHVVLDKYERAPGVLNRDVLELDDIGQFDLIVAISTLEHVGWDEAPRDPSKPLRAIRALRSALAPGGLLVITAPVGYNAALDAAFRSGEAGLSRAAALRREPGTSRWRELAPDDVWTTPYDFLIFRARAVLLGFIDAPQA